MCVYIYIYIYTHICKVQRMFDMFDNTKTCYIHTYVLANIERNRTIQFNNRPTRFAILNTFVLSKTSGSFSRPAKLRGWRNTVAVVLFDISNSMKAYPSVVSRRYQSIEARDRLFV